ncbi:MAG TPA: hypothetical protein VMW69_03450 [Spirochaetia bacterium]|nr:hypothetical protein [Spirochaetia bacterium]
MSRSVSLRGLALFFLLWILGIAAEAGFALQTPPVGKEPRVILTAFTAPDDDPVAQRLADTITESVELMMKLTGSLAVSRADFLTPMLSMKHALIYYRQEHADAAVFGSVQSVPGGGFRAELEIWRAANEGKEPTRIVKEIENPLAIFEISDELSLTAASSLVGHELSSGTLVIRNTGSLPHLAVYADGNLLGRDRSSFQVLSGARTIVVAKPGGALGDVPVQVFHVDISGRQTTTVTLTTAVAEGEKGSAGAPTGGSGTASPAVQPPPSGPSFADLRAQFESVRSKDRVYSWIFWGSYGMTLGDLILMVTNPSFGSGSTLTPESATGAGLLIAGLAGMAVTWIIDPYKAQFTTMKTKIKAFPAFQDSQSLDDLKRDLKDYRKADVPYTVSYWTSAAAALGGIVLVSSAANNTSNTSTFQSALGVSMILGGIGGMIGTSAADPYRAGIREIRRLVRSHR